MARIPYWTDGTKREPGVLAPDADELEALELQPVVLDAEDRAQIAAKERDLDELIAILMKGKKWWGIRS